MATPNQVVVINTSMNFSFMPQ